MNEYLTNNKKWLELLNDLTDIACLLDMKEMEANADVIRTAIDLLSSLLYFRHSYLSLRLDS